MLVAKIENGIVVTVADCRELCEWYPPTEEQLNDRGLVQVNAFRSYNSLIEKLVSCTPVIEGDWVYTVEVQQMTAEEIQAAKDSAMSLLRSNRNNLLLQSDWTQIPDCTLSNKTEWATYRQALRDFPATVEDARLPVEWPHSPDWQEMTM